MIPLPTSPAFSMPSGGSSSSSLSYLEEPESPVFVQRPTHIPILSSHTPYNQPSSYNLPNSQLLSGYNAQYNQPGSYTSPTYQQTPETRPKSRHPSLGARNSPTSPNVVSFDKQYRSSRKDSSYWSLVNCFVTEKVLLWDVKISSRSRWNTF